MAEIQYHQLSWEPLCLLLAVDSDISLVQLRDCCERWYCLAGRQCVCELRSLKVDDNGDSTVSILIEWICERCLPGFLGQMSAEFLQIQSIEAGIREARLDPGLMVPSDDVIFVPGQEIEFENGDRVEVAPFRIMRYAVSVEEYSRFTNATGYQTQAERDRQRESFGNNKGLNGQPKGNWSMIPASYLSYFDCLEYCRWAGLRMVMEAEWLAASICDNRIYSAESYRSQDFTLCASGRSLSMSGWEWTGSVGSDGKVIVRAGPKWARRANWKRETSRHRAASDPAEYDVMTSFRCAEQ